MPLGRYTVLTLVGSALWCFALAGVGWALGTSWERFHSDFRYVDYAVRRVAVVAGASACRRCIRRRALQLDWLAGADDPAR